MTITLEEAAARLKQVEKDIKRLKAADREFQRRFRTQRTWTLIFFGVIGLGGLVREGIVISPENRQSLEDVAVGVAVMLVGTLGVAGVNLEKFEPPREPPEEDEDGDEN